MTSRTVVKIQCEAWTKRRSTPLDTPSGPGMRIPSAAPSAKNRFDHNPAEHVGKSEMAPKGGHGCCGYR